jgi:hypothetical protein
LFIKTKILPYDDMLPFLYINIDTSARELLFNLYYPAKYHYSTQYDPKVLSKMFTLKDNFTSKTFFNAR